MIPEDRERNPASFDKKKGFEVFIAPRELLTYWKTL
jgi:hypothetical protein